MGSLFRTTERVAIAPLNDASLCDNDSSRVTLIISNTSGVSALGVSTLQAGGVAQGIFIPPGSTFVIKFAEFASLVGRQWFVSSTTGQNVGVFEISYMPGRAKNNVLRRSSNRS